MPDVVQAEKPNDVLAAEIKDALVAAHLIPENRQQELLAKLKTTGVRQEEWYTWIDIATARDERGGV